MKTIYFLFFIRYFKFLMLLILIKISSSYLSFNFPYSLTLSNGNIFIIHQNGIDICDYHLTTILENITTFSEDEKIKTEASLSKVTTAFEYRYIISIINDIVYIFNENGTLIHRDSNSILSEGETADYYTLVPIEKAESYYQYVIGYIHNNLLYFLNYKYFFSSGANIRINERKAKKHDNYDNNLIYQNSYFIENKALSCQYLIDVENDKILLCFFTIFDSSNYYLTYDYFSVLESGITILENYYPDHYIFYNTLCIKSIRTENKKKSLITLYSSNGVLHFFVYDIDNISEPNSFYFSVQCRTQYYGLKINYYKEREEYIISCINGDGQIFISFFDKDLNYINDMNKFIDCENIYGHSILFIDNEQLYYILSDVNCKGIKYPFIILNHIEEEEKEEEKQEKVEEEKEEEEEDKEEVEEEIKREEKGEEEEGEEKDKKRENEQKEEEEEDNNKENELKENEIEGEKKTYDKNEEKDFETNEIETTTIEEEKFEEYIEEDEFFEKEYEIEKEEEIQQIKTKINENQCQKDKSKYISETKNCIDDCSKDDNYKYEFRNNCYNKCPNKTKSSLDNIYLCEIECTYDFPYEIMETQNCVRNCSTINLFNNICKLNYRNEDLEDNILNNFKNDLLSNIYDSFLDDINKNPQMFKISNNIYQLSTLDNQNNNENNNISTINFGECENILREQYNIPKNISLLIFKMDAFVESFAVPKPYFFKKNT